MKRRSFIQLTATAGAAAIFAPHLPVKGGEVPYLSSLTTAAPYTLSVTTTSHVAVTVINIRRDRISEVDILLFDATNTLISLSVDSNVGRVLFIASAPTNGSGVMRITQGTNQIEVPVSPDAQATVDFA